jgi:hypothetical protein
MCSQRRHITDVEIYGKNAERFLSLRPSFSNTNNTANRYENKQKLNMKDYRESSSESICYFSSRDQGVSGHPPWKKMSGGGYMDNKNYSQGQRFFSLMGTALA